MLQFLLIINSIHINKLTTLGKHKVLQIIKIKNLQVHVKFIVNRCDVIVLEIYIDQKSR